MIVRCRKIVLKPTGNGFSKNKYDATEEIVPKRDNGISVNVSYYCSPMSFMLWTLS